jgi:hypothetical protein
MIGERASADAGTSSCKQKQVSPKALTFPIVVASAFLLLGLVGILTHEMWRDELQAWLITRDSGTLLELVRNMRYDGHPPLWYLLLYPVTRFTVNPVAMQFLNLGIATATAYIFARYAPFTKLQRVLFCFGYFPLYEYGIISRNYALGIFFIFCFCVVASRARRAKSYFLLALFLSALANTSAYGLMIALAFGLMLLFEVLSTGGALRVFKAGLFEIVVSILLFGVAVSLSVLQMLPPEDSGNYVNWHLYGNSLEVEMMLAIVWRAFVPLPQHVPHFWNTNLVASWWLMAAFSCVILIMTSLVFVRSRIALVAYLSGMAAILLFTFTKFYGGIRHHGHVYILFIACLWLARRFPREQELRSRSLERLTRIASVPGEWIFTGVLLAHVAAAAIACGTDWIYPFSNSKHAADFLRQKGMESIFIVADKDTIVSPLTAYLPRKIYYPRGDRTGTFIVWDKRRLNLPPYNSFEVAKRKVVEMQQDVLVVTNTRRTFNDETIIPIGEFTGSIILDEDYFLYLVTADKSSGNR